MNKEVKIKGWLTRSKQGDLQLHSKKPKYDEFSDSIGFWFDWNTKSVFIDNRLFPEVKWSDKEPTEIELVIKKK